MQRCSCRSGALFNIKNRKRGGLKVQCSSTGADTAKLLKVVQQAAQAGAQVVHKAVDVPRVVNNKGNQGLVTETDQASEVAVIKVIQEQFPEHAVLGEEGGMIGNPKSEYIWCIDPLDGTTNFAHAYPSFGVSVAVLKNSIPLASCVVEFLGGPLAWGTRTFCAERNHGATCNGQTLRVSNTKKISDSLVVTGFGYDHDEAWLANMELFKQLTDESRGVRRLGAAAVDLCHLALGIVDAYWEFRLQPWDCAAGVLIVEEAGGFVTQMDGSAFLPFDQTILATNDYLHQQMLQFTNPQMEKLVEEGVNLAPIFPQGYRLHTGAQLQ